MHARTHAYLPSSCFVGIVALHVRMHTCLRMHVRVYASARLFGCVPASVLTCVCLPVRACVGVPVRACVHVWACMRV